MRLADVLNVGRANAIPEGTLAAQLGVHPRKISQMAERERRDGSPICAASAEPAGLYIAQNVEELADYVQRLSNRHREVGLTCDALRNTLDEQTGQLRIEACKGDSGA